MPMFTVGKYTCDMLLAGYALAMLHICVDIAELWIMYCYCSCTVKCGLCVMICPSSDDGLSLLHGIVIELLLCLFVWCMALFLILTDGFISVLTG